MKATHELLTAGYAGHDPESFLSKLQDHDVELVVDVRQNPVSRKKGFSRSKLSEFLATHGVEYLHIGALGPPKDLRHLLKDRSCDLEEYFTVFRKYLMDQEGALDELSALTAEKRCCLICLEHLSRECHRSVVAEVVAGWNGHKVKVNHV